jgi:hypothetical protein
MQMTANMLRSALPFAFFAGLVAIVVVGLAVGPAEPAAAIAVLPSFAGCLAALAWAVLRADSTAAASEVQARWTEFERAYRAHVARLEGSPREDS